MTETIKLPNYYEPDWKNVRYGSLEELKELLLYKRIVKWDKDFLLLEDGTRVTIEMSESDCCAYLFNTDIFEVEIIGNIYENPELAEVE